MEDSCFNCRINGRSQARYFSLSSQRAPAHRRQVLHGMIEVQPLPRVGEPIIRQPPDPHRPSPITSALPACPKPRRNASACSCSRKASMPWRVATKPRWLITGRPPQYGPDDPAERPCRCKPSASVPAPGLGGARRRFGPNRPVPECSRRPFE